MTQLSPDRDQVHVYFSGAHPQVRTTAYITWASLALEEGFLGHTDPRLAQQHKITIFPVLLFFLPEAQGLYAVKVE